MNEYLIAAISVFGGSIIGYFVSLNLSHKEKKREIIISYLIDAYKTIENSVCRDSLDFELEKAIALVQLFGTNKQIELANKFAKELVKSKGADLNELLIELRAHLRKELKLEKCGNEVLYLRIKHK